MLSDERIRQIAMEYWSGTCGTRVPDMEKAIRAALTEQAETHALELRAYGNHRHDCGALSEQACTCGLSAAVWGDV